MGGGSRKEEQLTINDPGCMKDGFVNRLWSPHQFCTMFESIQTGRYCTYMAELEWLPAVSFAARFDQNTVHERMKGWTYLVPLREMSSTHNCGPCSSIPAIENATPNCRVIIASSSCMLSANLSARSHTTCITCSGSLPGHGRSWCGRRW